ncbi:hypothetical protein AXK56_16315 [Tsukamurella pulmonis]|uniref:4Fe-4S Wbl-type domain-containing protein n=1 Tax=Tsukamurella pulmonis TaxID=47312 RepID=A0A1H1A6Q8_9ACTN|nr:hypothetical protein [Tsukamurella pulmonis]KXO95775.1 hypothetical protein AXK56_16315 [Tsukamurella pulmonis]SDQ35299.1 hypothetical protein SAMN04489765_0076 [Tsukamurella pulmonis]SUQ39462.1 Uncharacterised protein [Tsukamurella pulmonis]
MLKREVVTRRADDDQARGCDGNPDAWLDLSSQETDAIRDMYNACMSCPILNTTCRQMLEVHLGDPDADPLREALWAGVFFGSRGKPVSSKRYLRTRSTKLPTPEVRRAA